MLISSDAAVTASSSLSITLVNTEHCMLHCNEYYWECSEGGHWHWLKPQMHRSQLPLHLSLIWSAQFEQFAILCTSCTTNVQCHNSLHNLYNQCTYCKELCIGLHIWHDGYHCIALSPRFISISHDLLSTICTMNAHWSQPAHNGRIA